MADTSTIARPYAKALFDLASGERKLPAWSEALRAAATVAADAGAKRALSNPAFDDGARAALVGSIASAIKGGELLATPEGKNLLRILAENDRLTVLPQIAAQFDLLKAEAENTVNVTVTSATPVDKALADQIKKSLEQKLKRTVELTLNVDASLIGGAVIQADDMVIDGSVRTRLQRLTEALVG
ncbi:MAG TPA: F0F1 ATP synthase subunit delta [Gammaproteobacteria bacterium]|nr:F0F1 ATP synthase subunit delta [Gammaproteobacteria bacterium]